MLHALEVFATMAMTYLAGCSSVLVVQWFNREYDNEVDQEVKLRLLRAKNDKRHANFMERCR